MSALGLGRPDRWPLGIVLATAVALCVPRTAGPIDLRYDAGVYFATGGALAEGRGYVIPSEPGTVAEVQYPPALPAAVAAVAKAVGTTDAVVAGRAMRLLYLALTLVYAAATYGIARRYLAPWWSAFAALIPTVHAYTVFLTGLMQAELPYAVVTALFFVVAAPRPGRAWRPADPAAPPPRAGVPELLAALAFGVRTAGLALLGAWVLELARRRRWGRAALAAAVAAACVGGWQAYARGAEAGRRRDGPAYAYQYAPYQFYNVSYQANLAYVDPFKPELGRITARQFAARTAANARTLVWEVGELVTADEGWWNSLLPWRPTFWARVGFWLSRRALLAAAGIATAGVVILAYRGAWIVPLYLAASLALIVVTPWPGQFWRYMAPLTPLFAVGTAVTLAALPPVLARALAWALARAPGLRGLRGGRLARWAPRAVPVAVAALMLGVQAYALRQAWGEIDEVAYAGRDGRPVRYGMMYYDERWRAHDAAVDWLARRASPRDVVITTTPHWVYLRTGLRSVMPPYDADAARADSLMAAVPGRYLILDQLKFLDVSRRYAEPVVARFPDRWRLVYRGGPRGSSVYEYAGPAGAAR